MLALLEAVVATTLTAIFLLLAAAHVYWACGGVVGRSVVVPEVGGRPAFRPSAAAMLVVALLLVVAALVVAVRCGLAEATVPSELSRFGVLALAVVFLLRMVGDFRTFGLFKVVRGTQFARYDSRAYTPLCLAVAVGCLFLAR